ncbi:MAG: hypothetical protein AABW54_01135, partial [Candidatus Micrarchaeota archaeon]
PTLLSPGSDEPIVTPAAATPQPTAFEGTGGADAAIASLASQFLFECSSGAIDEKAVTTVPGVLQAAKLSSTLWLVDTNATVFNATQGAFELKYNASACGRTRVMRLASATLAGANITLVAGDGKNQTIYKRQLDVAYGASGFPAYVQVARQANDSVRLAVYAKLQNGLTQTFFAQEDAPASQQSIAIFSAPARVISLSNAFTATKQVPRDLRTHDWKAEVEQLNHSGSVTVKLWEFTPSNRVTVNAVSIETAERLAAALANESIIKNASAENETVTVTVAENASEGEVTTVMARLGVVNYTIENSTLSLQFTATDGGQAATAIGIALGSVKISRVAIVELEDRRKAAVENNVIMPTTFNAEVAGGAAENSTVQLNVFALVQDGVAASVSATGVS